MRFNAFRVTLLKVRGAAALPALLALLMMTAGAAFAEINTWSNIGPEGGTFNRNLPDPQHPCTVYATGYAGIATIYKTTDGAQNWNAASSGVTGYSAHALAIDPTSSETLYALVVAGEMQSQLFRSTDGGSRWIGLTATPKLDCCSVSLAVDLQTSTIYLGTCRNGVFRSSDGGSSWNAANSGLTSLFVTSLTRDPQDPYTLWSGTLGGVFIITFNTPAQ